MRGMSEEEEEQQHEEHTITYHGAPIWSVRSMARAMYQISNGSPGVARDRVILLIDPRWFETRTSRNRSRIATTSTALTASRVVGARHRNDQHIGFAFHQP